MNEFIKDFRGRWVSESVTDQDVEGFWKTGEKLRFVIINRGLNDRRGIEYEWQVEKDGSVIGKSLGVISWDPVAKCLRNFSFAAPGYLNRSTITKKDGAWVEDSEQRMRIVDTLVLN